MGVAAGFIRLWSGSILPCMLLHMVHNTFVIVAELYLGI
jgi:membrane protease YdiL (CAAX protease family)